MHTARTDHRIKAVTTVVPGNMGTSFRSFQPDGPAAALDALADARTEESRTGEPARVNWLPDTLEEAQAVGATDIDTTRAITYYRTERGGNEYSTNRRLARGDSLLLGYDAYHLVDQLMTQPLQVILAGRIGNTGSYESGMQLWNLAPNPVDLMVVDGAHGRPQLASARQNRLNTRLPPRRSPACQRSLVRPRGMRLPKGDVAHDAGRWWRFSRASAVREP
ncbi:hypothetical protein [Streptomyces sp. NPDC127119]|uniref:hypothetical protein n=1 Tax=Streptomyces sp. NPDC127119 TaxID=3345370 RepID=UPI00363C7B92